MDSLDTKYPLSNKALQRDIRTTKIKKWRVWILFPKKNLYSNKKIKGKKHTIIIIKQFYIRTF